MIRGLVYLTGVVTLLIVGVIAAVAFRVDTWPWRSYAENGRQYLVGKLEEAEIPVVAEQAPSRVVPPVAEPPAQSPMAVRHVVASGDTLYRIAGKYYGDVEKWRLIATANGIAKPSDLRVGRVLLVPVGNMVADAETQPPRGTSWPEPRLALSPAMPADEGE